MKLKARSRLASTLPQVAPQGAYLPIERSSHQSKPQPSLRTLPRWWIRRQPKIASLMIGLVSYGYLAYLLTHVFPSQAQDWIIPGGFLPIIGLAGLGHACVWGFITLNSRLAWLISLGLSWLLWLQLHHFVVNWTVISLTLSVTIVIEIVSTVGTYAATRLKEKRGRDKIFSTQQA